MLMRTLAVTALLLGARVAASQPLPALGLPSNAHVRLTSAALPRLMRGLLLHSEDEALLLRLEDGSERRLPIASLTRLELLVGYKRATVKGLLLGAAVGLVTGLTTKIDRSNCGGNSGRFCSRGGTVAVAIAGAGSIGAGIGWLVRSERWQPIALHPR